MTTRLPPTPFLPDRGSPVAVHVQIADWLRRAIAAGELSPGDRLPGERDIATALGVSRMTLRHALAELESAGTLVRVPGRTGGSYVTEPSVDVDLTELAGLTEQLRRGHRKAGARVLRAARTTARSAGATAAEALRVPLGAPLVLVERLRSANGVPLALERSWFPARLVPGLLDRRLTGSLYSLLDKQYRLQPHSAVEELEPVLADDDVAAVLGIDPGDPLMLVRRTASTKDGTAIEYAKDLFRADRVRFLVRRGPRGPRPLQAVPTPAPASRRRTAPDLDSERSASET